MKRPLLSKIDTQEYVYQERNLLPKLDPSLRASAQDDSQLSGGRRGKEGGAAAFFSPLFSSRWNVILSEEILNKIRDV